MVSLPNHAPSSEANAIASRRQNRTANHYLVELDFHVDGRPVGKLAARCARPADQELVGHLRQRLARGLSSGSERWHRNHDVLRRERHGLDVDRESSAISSLSLLNHLANWT